MNDTYGETLAGGSFFGKVGHWFSDHKGAIVGALGTAAFVGAQFIPGVDAVVDTTAAADVAATSAEAAEAAEGTAEAEGESVSAAKKAFKNPVQRKLAGYTKSAGKFASVSGAVMTGQEMLQDQSQTPPSGPPALAPPPNLVGEYDANTSGNPYLH
eukprot:COSAG01_NODE_9289_length_2493_cov_192.326650_3_plen_156_part_00